MKKRESPDFRSPEVGISAEPVCAYRTSFVLVKPGNQEARKEISALELTANFYSIIQNFFFPSYSVSLVKVVCHLQKVKENPVEK